MRSGNYTSPDNWRKTLTRLMSCVQLLTLWLRICRSECCNKLNAPCHVVTTAAEWRDSQKWLFLWKNVWPQTACTWITRPGELWMFTARVRLPVRVWVALRRGVICARPKPCACALGCTNESPQRRRSNVGALSFWRAHELLQTFAMLYRFLLEWKILRVRKGGILVRNDYVNVGTSANIELNSFCMHQLCLTLGLCRQFRVKKRA